MGFTDKQTNLIKKFEPANKILSAQQERIVFPFFLFYFIRTAGLFLDPGFRRGDGAVSIFMGRQN